MKKTVNFRLPAGKSEKALTTKKLHRHPNRPITEMEIWRLLFALDNNRDDALVRLGLSVGLRVPEVVIIRTSEIDFERGFIKIWDGKKKSAFPQS